MPSGSRADVATIGSQKAFNQVFVKNLFLLDYLMGSDKKQRRYMNFGEALELLKQGKKIARSGWNGKGMYLIYFSPVAHNLETLLVYDSEIGTEKPLLPFILMKTADDMYVPWLASQTDILAEDWQEV